MKLDRRELSLVCAVAALVLLGGAGGAGAQSQNRFLVPPTEGAKAPHPAGVQRCVGPLRLVTDVGFEGVKVSGVNLPVAGGGGECPGFAGFDPVPLLTTTVTLTSNSPCLNAHLSALVGSAVTYGVSNITMFQVTLTSAAGVVQHMYGHYETPYGLYCPAVAIEAEGDVDEFSANFFQRVGTGPGTIPPGVYTVNVWWAGGPLGPGVGAIGAAFVLKLYQG